MSSPLDDGSITVWAIGENGNWEAYRDAGIITLGYDNTCSDLSGVQSIEELELRVEREFSTDTISPESNTKPAILYRFASRVKAGDVVIAKNGTDTPKGVGVVASEYRFDPGFPLGDSNDCHYRWVRWMVDLTQTDGKITLSSTQFTPSTEVKSKSGAYEEIRDELEGRESAAAKSLHRDIERLEKVALSSASRCADPEAIEPPQAEVNQLFENYGGSSDFVTNLEQGVGEPLQEETREELRRIVKSHPVTDPDILGALQSEQLTAWTSPDSNFREYAALRPGDWIIHVSGDGPTTVCYLQRVDVVPMNLPDSVRSELTSAIFSGTSYSRLILSTTPIVELNVPSDEFSARLKEAAGSDSDSPHRLDVTGFFQQIRPEITYQGGGAKELLEAVLQTEDQLLPNITKNTSTSGDTMTMPLGLSSSDVERDSTAMSSVAKIDNSDAHFILITGSGDYNDDITSHYHFTTQSPGHDQLRTAVDSGRVSFIGLRKRDNGWKFDSVGQINEITAEETDDETHYYADTGDVEFIEPVPLDVVDPLIDKGEIYRRGINKVRQADLEVVLEWHFGPGVQAVEEIQNWDRSALYKEAFAHLIAGRNLIFYGPPGTGKTYTATRLIEAVCGPDTDCEPDSFNIETANAEWTNYDVVGGWAPGPDSNSSGQSEMGKADWHAREGIITASARRCTEKLERNSRPSWLLIDEINRANLDQAFGDVFTLLDLDYRAQTPLTYADESQPLPHAFRILATQNTHDLAQLFSLGYAFRRRFAFIEVPSEIGDSSIADTSSVGLTQLNYSVSDTLSAVDSDLKELIEQMAFKRLSYSAQREHTMDNTPPIDPAAIFPQFASPPRIETTLDDIKSREMGLDGEDCIETVLALATAATQRGVVDIGKAIVMDVIAYVLAYELAFPGEADGTTVDQGCCAYLVPQFETVMSEFRQADALNQDSETREAFREVIGLAEAFGLEQTASRLATALESNRIFG